VNCVNHTLLAAESVRHLRFIVISLFAIWRRR